MGVLKAKVSGNWVPVDYNGGPNPANALGIVAMGTVVAVVPTDVTTGTQVTSNIAFIPLVGRRYRIVISLRAILTRATAYLQVWFRDGTTNLHADSILPYIPATTGAVYNTFYYDWIVDGDGVAKSYNVWLVAQGGQTVSVYGSSAFFYLEDVGPNSSPALPLPPTPQAWTPVTTFENGWLNYGGGWPAAAYRKIGDEVQLRGLIYAGTANVPAFTLPVGFRSAYGYHLIAPSNATFATVRVSVGGVITPGPPVDNAWVDLAGLRYSVTP